MWIKRNDLPIGQHSLSKYIRFKTSTLRLDFYNYTLCKKCPYSELFLSLFFRIRTEYGEIRSIYPYSVRMQENADQNNSNYGHFSRSDSDVYIVVKGEIDILAAAAIKED